MNYLRGKLHSCRNLFLLFLLLFSVQAGAEPATCTWDGGWDQTPEAGDHIVIAGGDLTWGASLPDTVGSWTQGATYAGTVTFQTVFGETGFTEFTIEGDAAINGGTWTHPANTGTEQYRLKVNVGGDLKVGESGAINANEKGYAGAQGPGRGGGRSGGGYGGMGGQGDMGTPGGTYGSVTAPVNLGSGGTSGRPGGGAIIIKADGALDVEGENAISAIGSSGANGAGAGGSVFITADSLTGSGNISVEGGGGADSIRAAGGGGRIAVILTGAEEGFSSFTGSFAAYGGPNLSGAAGTVYLETKADNPGGGELIVDNGGRTVGFFGINPFTELSSAGDTVHSFSRLTIRKNGNLSVREADVLDFSELAIICDSAATAFLTISHADNITFPDTFILPANCTFNLDIPVTAAGNWIVPGNSVLSHNRNYNAETCRIDLTLTGSLTVESGGAINANEKGYAGEQGPGRGGGRSGGGYGGMGGQGNAGTPGGTYGSVTAPVNLGSGGTSGRPGGGAIIIKAGGALDVEGENAISAFGSSGANGAGAGGSVFITADSLTGSGNISVEGGGGADSIRAAGGGGRIAVILTGAEEGFSSFTGSFAAYGGPNLSGAAGTVYLETAADAPGGGKLIINNPHTHNTASGVLTELPASYAPLSFPDELQRVTLIIRDNGKVGLTADITVGDLIFE